jgi:uncharacterized protein (TIGR00369 family)
MVKTRAPREIAPDLLDRLRAQFSGFPLTRGWGLRIVSVDSGRAVLGLDPSEATTNGPTGIINGGVLATLADMACALALTTHFDGRMPFATSDLHIRYLEPVDGPVSVEASVIRASPRSAVMECKLMCGPRVMALCTANFIIKARAQEPPKERP